MKTRIMQLMKSKGMTQQEFSRATGISPASLSSIFTGRTAPTMKHAEALHRYFPQLNMSWLLFGEGEMFVPSEAETEVPEGASSEASTEAGMALDGLSGGEVSRSEALSAIRGSSPSFSGVSQPFSAPSQPFGEPARGVRSEMAVPGACTMANVRAREANSSPSPYAGLANLVNYPDKKPRRIVEIRIFFDDGPFETFKGNE